MNTQLKRWLLFGSPLLIILSGLAVAGYATRNPSPPNQGHTTNNDRSTSPFPIEIQSNKQIRRYLQKLTKDSELIILGEVESATVGQERNGLIYTYVTIELIESIKGHAEPFVTVRNIGGNIGNSVIRAHGDFPDPTSWHAGEKALLFLKQQNNTNYYYTSDAGKLDVVQLPDGQEALLVNSWTGSDEQLEGLSESASSPPLYLVMSETLDYLKLLRQIQ